MNIPLTNINGIRTKLNGIKISPGLSVGIDAKTIPRAEKTSAERIILDTNIVRLVILCPINIIPINADKPVTPTPNTTPPMAFPHKIDAKLIGADKKRSKVLIRLSIGIEAGPILLLAQKTV
jgi:hypothetical protein